LESEVPRGGKNSRRKRDSVEKPLHVKCTEGKGCQSWSGRETRNIV